VERDFDRWLEDELSTGFAPMSSKPIPEPRYRAVGAPLWPRRTLALLAGAPAAMGLKLTVAFAAAALAAGGATAALVATSHGSHGASNGTVETSSDKSSTPTSHHESTSASTTNHGQAVTSAVASCKAMPSPSPQSGHSTEGIGQCVASVANENGQDHQSTDHPEGPPSPHPTPHH